MRTDMLLRAGWEVGRLAQDGVDREALIDGGWPSGGEWFSAEAPVEVHDVLLDRGVIPDPTLSKNAAECAWVGDEDWVYRCRFVTPEMVGEAAWLTFRGVDTVADAYLNGTHIASFGNLCREYRVDVAKTLAPAGSQNVLVVVIESPSRAVDEVEQPTETVGRINKERYIRKGAGDWGSYLGARPRFLTVGIHREVVLSVAGPSWVDGVRARTLSLDESRAIVRIDVDSGGDRAGQLRWTVTGPDGEALAEGNRALGDGAFTVDIDRPQLWWPRSHGPSPVYAVDVQLLDEAGRTLDRAATTFGLRTVELQQRDQTTGEPLFRFLINGEPIFLRGSCWAPVEGRTHCWSPDRAMRLLDLAEHADMNTIRVWGGGLPPEDDFYDECDRRGILVWQDFMYDFGVYPTGEPYDENHREEAVGLVRRLRNHPSIFVWVGGNEGHMGWNFTFGDEPVLGRELFEELLRDVCAEYDGTRPYHASSPFGGPVANWPLEGDWHDYTTLTYSHRSSVPAFASETGRVSAPAMRSMRKFLAPEELWPDGHDGSVRRPGEPAWPPMWGYRSVDGSWDKIGSIEDYCEPSDAAGFVRVLGTAHGEYLRRRVERHRRGRPDGDRTAGRRCWGNLTWRLNDAWPILYWSAIDYYLEPKIPYYFLRRAYAPVLVSFEETPDELAVWVTNDSAQTVTGVLRVTRRSFDGRVHAAAQHQVTVRSGESQRIIETATFGPIPLRSEFLHATFGEHESIWLLNPERYLHLPQARLAVSTHDDLVSISSDVFVRQVTIDRSASLDRAITEDNYFDLAPGVERKVRIRNRDQTGEISVSALNADPVTVPLRGA